MPGAEKSSKWGRKDLLLFILLMVFSSILLFKDLGANTPLYFDEALYSWTDVQFLKEKPGIFFPEGNLRILYNVKPPLKTWLKYPLLKIFGVSTFNLRFLDAVMGLGTVALIFLIGIKLWDSIAGFAAGYVFVTFRGILTDYWARVNGYDAGAILGTVAFFYFLLFHWEKRLGWLWCGLSLSFIVYFKHIAAVLPLAIAGLYLLLDRGFRGILDRRFLLMLISAGVPVLIFYIPFAIYNKTFLGHFFGYEVFTVITEGTGKHGRGDSLFYLKSMVTATGSWFIPVAASIIASSIVYLRNKSKPLLLMLLWFFLPLFALSIAATRINRYMFPSYVAAALLTGFAFVYAIGYVMGFKGKKEKARIIKAAKAMAVFLFAVVFIYAAVESFRATEPFYRENYHRLADYYKKGNPGKLFLTEGNMRRYGWAEQVIFYSMGDKVRVIGQGETDSALIAGLGNNDAIALYNYRIFELFYYKKTEGINPDGYFLMDFAIDDSFYSRHKVFRKVLLFRRDSPLVQYFKSEGIEPIRLLSVEEVDILSPRDFITYIAKIAFGAGRIDEKTIDYYSNALINGKYMRRELSERFACYSRWFTSTGFVRLLEKECKPDKSAPYYYFSEFYSPVRPGKIYMRGLRLLNFSTAIKCNILRTRARWILLPKGTDIESLLLSLGGDDTLVMRRSDLIRLLSAGIANNENAAGETVDSLIKSAPLKPELLSDYLFFSLKGRAGYVRIQDKFFNISGIVRKEGAVAKYLSSRGVSMLPLNPPDRLIDWSEPSDEKFIRDSVRVIFDAGIEAKFVRRFKDKLDRSELTRKELFGQLLDQARKIEY